MATKTQKNMRLDSELVTRLSNWAEAHGMTYVAATEYAMRSLLDRDQAQAAGADAGTAATETGLAAAGAAGDDALGDAATLRELMAANAQLTVQLGEIQKTANEASRSLLAATMQIKSLPSADEVDAKERVARNEGLSEGREQGRAERDRELASLGVFGYMSWRRVHRAQAGSAQD